MESTPTGSFDLEFDSEIPTSGHGKKASNTLTAVALGDHALPGVNDEKPSLYYSPMVGTVAPTLTEV